MARASMQFQFLIGTLKTLLNMEQRKLILVSIPYRYAKNSIAILITSPRFEFQFLIGTLKTLVSSLDCLSTARVSIPYRYAKNSREMRHCIR